MPNPHHNIENSRKDARGRLDALAPERRTQLLDPAETEFAAYGFQGASLNRVLEAAGMSKGQAYYYVASKADLYRAVIERALERLTGSLHARYPDAARPDEFWTQIRDFFHRLTAALKKDETLAALARGIYEGPDTQAALSKPLAKIRKHLDQTLAIGRTIGAVRTDVPLSMLRDTLFAAAREIDRWFADHWNELSTEEAMRLNGAAVDLIQSMAAPRDSETEPRKRSSTRKPTQGAR